MRRKLPDGKHQTNCGGCGQGCSGNNNTPTCSGSQCVANCSTGFANCDNTVRTNGCNINTQTDPNNCNGCGAVCASTAQHVTGTSCSGGTCGGMCALNYGDCNNNRTMPNSDGCETLLNDPNDNCGGCGIVCKGAGTGSVPTCNATGPGGTYQCGFSCVTGYKACNGTCISNFACCTDNDCSTTNPCVTEHCSITHSCIPTNNDGAQCTGTLCDHVCQGGVCTARTVTCTPNGCTSAPYCNPATGTCTADTKYNGVPCSGGCYTSDGGTPTCNNGVCSGAPKDCSGIDTTCQVGVCNANTTACELNPAADGTACTSTNACLTNTSCTSGVCGGTPIVCPSPSPGNPCSIATCDQTKGCGIGNAPSGTECSIAGCNQAASCDANGNCVCGNSGDMSAAVVDMNGTGEKDMSSSGGTTSTTGTTGGKPKGSGKSGGCALGGHDNRPDWTLLLYALVLLGISRRWPRVSR